MINYCKIKTTFCAIFVVSLIFSGKSFAVDYWIQQSSPTNKNLTICTFVDSLNGWACGDSGLILHTSDGGTSWVIQNTPVNYYLEDIVFINENTGWAVSNEFFFSGSTILKTTNGGTNWDTTTFFDTTVVLSSIQFTDSNNGWVGSYYGNIFKTTDGGANWSLCPDSSTSPGFTIRRIKFYSPGYGLACGGRIDIVGTMWKTTNNGSVWYSQPVSSEPVFDFEFMDSLNILAVGGDFEYGAFVSKTTDGGVNWNYTSLKLFGQGEALAIRTPSNFWVPLGFSQNWAVTFNGGTSWLEIPVEQTRAVHDAQFIDPMHGWAVGDSGLILKFNPKSVGIEPISGILPGDYSLLQNYPNPFNPFTTIEYVLKKPALVKITVFDITGKQLDVFDLGKKSIGTHRINFNGSRYASGVYYYTLNAGDDFVETKKMVIVK